MLFVSVGTIRCFSANGMTTGKDYLLGALCMVVCFAVMQNRALAINGMGYKDIIAAVKSKFYIRQNQDNEVTAKLKGNIPLT